MNTSNATGTGRSADAAAAAGANAPSSAPAHVHGRARTIASWRVRERGDTKASVCARMDVVATGSVVVREPRPAQT